MTVYRYTQNCLIGIQNHKNKRNKTENTWKVIIGKPIYMHYIHHTCTLGQKRNMMHHTCTCAIRGTLIPF